MAEVIHIPAASERVAGIAGGSDGWEVFERSREMIRGGRQVTELTQGEHDIRTDPEILTAMDASARNGNTGYAPVPGMRSLREAVAARVEARTGVPTTWENVLITAGGQAGLFAAHMTACQPGDRALYIDPHYATYPGTIRGAGAVPVAVSARSEDGFVPRPEAIGAVADGARALLINSPNNPTGAVYGRGVMEGIAEVVRAHGLWLISDEVYDTQVWTGTHISPRGLPGMADHTLVVGSLSKSHAMTGSRLGWVIGPAEVIAVMADLSTVTNYGVAGFVQEAGLHALGLGPAFEEKIAAPYRRRRGIAVEVLGQRKGLTLLPASAAMYVMADIRATGMTGEDFAHRLLDDHAIAVMPGESFGAASAGHIRIALTVADDALREALSTLGDLADALAGA